MGLLDTMTAEEAARCAGQPKAQPLDVSQWQLSPWAKWVAADAHGEVWQYQFEPVLARNVWGAQCGRFIFIGYIDMTGIDWRKTLTPVNQEQQAQNERHNITLRNIDAARGVLKGFFGCEPSEVVQRRMRGYSDEDDTQNFARSSTPISTRDIVITATPSVPTLAWQLAQLDADELGALARQLARADSTKASLIAEALWSEAMDVEHAQLQADDAALEDGNQRGVWGDRERHSRIWDAIEAQLRVAQ